MIYVFLEQFRGCVDEESSVCLQIIKENKLYNKLNIRYLLPPCF